jgi:RHS repeat-associated protein
LLIAVTVPRNYRKCCKEVRFTYDATGLNRKVERYVDGLLKVTTTNAFDADGRLTGIAQENSAGVFSNDVYELDLVDRLKTEAETVDGQIRSIDYDNTDQVTTVSGSNSEGYTYDKNGNRINAGYVTGSGNRLLSDGTYTYDYDAEGNRTRRTNLLTQAVDLYTWDYRNRLTSIVSKTSITGTVTQTVGYEYDVDDQRVKKTVDGVVENYFIDRNQIAFVTDGGGNETFHYLYGLNVDQVLAQDSSTGMLWTLADRLGSIDLLTDEDGVVVDKRSFDSFGRVLNQTNPSVSFRYGYTARELDLESGLHYYRARYYDSNVGRFISVDPMGFEAGDTNLYRYVSNNSTNANDPTGMWLNFAIGAAIGGGLDLGIQLWQNGGDFSKVNWTSVGVSTLTGAIGGGIGGLLAKKGVGLAARTAITAGAEFNLGYWGKVAENKITGKDDLFEGALLSGSIGGIAGAGGELISTGIGAWAKQVKLDRVGRQLDDMAAETQDLIRQLDDLGAANQRLKVEWNEAQGRSIRANIDNLKGGGKSYPSGFGDFSNQTRPSLQPNSNRLPDGFLTEININEKNAVNIESLSLENASALTLSRKGYRVKSNPTDEYLQSIGYVKATVKKPDLIVEGRVFDVYSPQKTSVTDIRKQVKGKVDKKQADRIIVNIDVVRESGKSVDLENLAKKFRNNPVAGLKELIIINNGNVINFYNNGKVIYRPD